MASILRQIVASPRARHPEARLDLCYVTDNIIVTSGPSSVWPKKAYRNPTDQLVAFLDKTHGQHWAIFEFRAEGTGYPDSEVYNRIHHFPWPDHHPPPFEIIPNLMAAMRNWLQAEGDDVAPEDRKRVAVVHCKAGKGRSGTSACSYLISEEGWKREDALNRFTIRRMRSGFGNGVSIPSQLRWVRYVDRWTNSMQKKYVQRPVQIVEIQVTGLRDGVKVCIEGFVDHGRGIKTFHTFTRDEKTVIDGVDDSSKHLSSLAKQNDELLTSPVPSSPLTSTQHVNEVSKSKSQDVILRPSQVVELQTSDVNIDFERRNTVKYTGYTMVTSIAHVWFNTWFEGGYEGADSGVFEINWQAMDGIKGSVRKGAQAFDQLKVVWKYSEQARPEGIREPERGEPVPEGEPADWKGEDPEKGNEARHSDGVDSGRSGASALTMGAMIETGAASITKELGLRKSHPDSTNVSRASSQKHIEHPTSPSAESPQAGDDDDDVAGVKPFDPLQEEHDHSKDVEGVEGKADNLVGRMYEASIGAAASLVSAVKGTSHDEAQDHKP